MTVWEKLRILLGFSKWYDKKVGFIMGSMKYSSKIKCNCLHTFKWKCNCALFIFDTLLLSCTNIKAYHKGLRKQENFAIYMYWGISQNL